MVHVSDQHRTIIQILYQLFYRKRHGNEDYVFIPSAKGNEHINNFLSLCEKKYSLYSIGKSFLINYFIFQFEYWRTLEIVGFNGKMNIQYILGKKAFERWTNRDQQYDWQIHTLPVLKQYDLTLELIVSTIPTPQFEISRVKKNEEIEKKRFYNTDEGFNHCIDNTSLYDNQSTLCITCISKRECKTLLKNNYPQIYKNRYAAIK